MLKVRGLTRRMGEKRLESINLDVERGTVHTIIGNNGVGKQRCLRQCQGITLVKGL